MSDGLPWVRLDANIGTNRKIVRLLALRDGAKAFALYITALGWAGGHGTDGRIPGYVLPMLHGNPRLANMLIECELWEPVDRYDPAHTEPIYTIRNYADRQELARVTEAKQQGKRRAICVRWMKEGRACTCGEHT